MSIAATPSSDRSVASAGRPSRPGILTAIAVIEIAFGVLGVISAIVMLVATSLGAKALLALSVPTGDAQIDASMGQVETMWSFVGPFMVVISLLMLAFGTVEIAAGVGLWRLKEWGVSLTKVIAWIMIVLAAIGIVAAALSWVIMHALPLMGATTTTPKSRPTLPAYGPMAMFQGIAFWIVALVAVNSRYTRAVLDACAAADRAAGLSGQPR